MIMYFELDPCDGIYRAFSDVDEWPVGEFDDLIGDTIPTVIECDHMPNPGLLNPKWDFDLEDWVEGEVPQIINETDDASTKLSEILALLKKE